MDEEKRRELQLLLGAIESQRELDDAFVTERVLRLVRGLVG